MISFLPTLSEIKIQTVVPRIKNKNSRFVRKIAYFKSTNPSLVKIITANIYNVIPPVALKANVPKSIKKKGYL